MSKIMGWRRLWVTHLWAPHYSTDEKRNVHKVEWVSREDVTENCLKSAKWSGKTIEQQHICKGSWKILTWKNQCFVLKLRLIINRVKSSVFCKWKLLEEVHTRRNSALECIPRAWHMFWKAQVTLIMLGMFLKGSPGRAGAFEAPWKGRKPSSYPETPQLE